MPLKRSRQEESNNTKKKSQMMNEVDHTNRPKISGLTCDHRW